MKYAACSTVSSPHPSPILPTSLQFLLDAVMKRRQAPKKRRKSEKRRSQNERLMKTNVDCDLLLAIL